MLDIHTLILVHFMVNVINVIVIFILWRQFRGRFIGLGWFLAQVIALALGMGLMFLRGSASAPLMALLPNLTLLFGAFMYLRGLEAYTQKRISHVPYYLAFGCAMVLLPLAAIMETGFVLQEIIMAALVVMVEVPKLLIIHRHRSREIGSPIQGIAIVIWGYISISIAKVVLLSGLLPWNNPQVSQFVVLTVYTALAILTTFFTVLLVTQKLMDDLSRQEARATAREVYYRGVVAHAPIGIFHSTWEGKFLYANPHLATMLGYASPEELITHTTSMTVQIYRDPTERPRIIAQLAASEDWVHQDAVEWIHRDGRTIIVDMTGRQVRDSAGTFLHLEGFIIDITHRVENDTRLAEYRDRLEQLVEERGNQIRQSEKLVMLGTLAAGVAHEINNPVNFISLGLPLFKKTWLAAEPIIAASPSSSGIPVGAVSLAEISPSIVPSIDTMIDGTRRLEKIVQELREYARPDRSDMNMDIDLSEVVRSSLRLMDPLLRKNVDRLDLLLAEEPILVHGSTHKLGQVVLNLLQNACQAMTGTERSISVQTRFDHGERRAQLLISDTGSGIDKNIMSRLTDPFFTTRQSSGGLGLGLSIVSRILAEHGGTLSYSDHGGGGTVALVSLPGKAGTDGV